jgi:hypothetical protein
LSDHRRRASADVKAEAKKGDGVDKAPLISTIMRPRALSSTLNAKWRRAIGEIATRVNLVGTRATSVNICFKLARNQSRRRRSKNSALNALFIQAYGCTLFTTLS